SGGYGNSSTNDSDVKYAAGFAVKNRAESEHLEISLVRVVKAQTQVVAGRNYRLCLAVKIVDEGQNLEDVEEVLVSVVVYRDLQDTYTLKSWNEADCSGQ
ncbi:MAG: cystatin domain-containing protein, partial [Pyrinomonadaceae bacterium]|nr:cystatin domain-containing protein [Pyrinomonadaceae bacterium]